MRRGESVAFLDPERRGESEMEGEWEALSVPLLDTEGDFEFTRELLVVGVEGGLRVAPTLIREGDGDEVTLGEGELEREDRGEEDAEGEEVSKEVTVNVGVVFGEREVLAVKVPSSKGVEVGRGEGVGVEGSLGEAEVEIEFLSEEEGRLEGVMGEALDVGDGGREPDTVGVAPGERDAQSVALPVTEGVEEGEGRGVGLAVRVPPPMPPPAEEREAEGEEVEEREGARGVEETVRVPSAGVGVEVSSVEAVGAAGRVREGEDERGAVGEVRGEREAVPPASPSFAVREGEEEGDGGLLFDEPPVREGKGEGEEQGEGGRVAERASDAEIVLSRVEVGEGEASGVVEGRGVALRERTSRENEGEEEEERESTGIDARGEGEEECVAVPGCAVGVSVAPRAVEGEGGGEGVAGRVPP